MSKSLPNTIPLSIQKKYKFRREIGHGSYGTVWCATDLEKKHDVAIKQVGPRNFTEAILAKRALRELRLLKHLHGHENLPAFIDVDINDPNNFNELYLVEGLMEADLNQIIKSGQSLTEQHYQYFTYQLLRGLKWIHSADVLHRDLKPGNLLVNSDCELRVCDFGLARGASDGEGLYVNTEYVATRYYRAPEVVLSPTHYTKAIDMWSVGCIFGEILGGKIMFKGKDYVDQLQKIFEVLGTPEDLILGSLCSTRVMKYIQSWPKRPRMSFAKLYPHADPQALDLLGRLLEFNPKKRITADEALQHPYLSAYHQPDDEPAHPAIFDFAFEKAQSIDEIKKLIIKTVGDYKHDNGNVRELHMQKEHPVFGGLDQVPRFEEEKNALDAVGNIEEELMLKELKISE